MTELTRFGVSLEKSLLETFDSLIRSKRYTNRSEAIRDLIREELLKKEWQTDKKVAGAIVYVYHHHQRELLNKITEIQHRFEKVIVSTQHIHMDYCNCLEVAAVKGNAREVKKLADTLRAVKGVQHAALNMAAVEKAVH